MKKDPATRPSEPGKKRETTRGHKDTPLTPNDALKESEERFRKIFENSPIGMALVAPDFRFFAVNPAWIAMTGYSEAELLKMSFKDITHPEHFAGDLEHIRELIAGTIPVYSTEKRYIRKDKSILWGLLRVTAIRDDRGVFRYLAAQIEDITLRKQAEDALRESEAKFRTLFESADDAIFFMNSTTFLDCNPSTLRIYGCTREQIIGHSPVDFSPELQPDGRRSREKAQEKIAAALAGQPQSFEWVHLHADGTPFDAEVTLNRIFLKEGDFLQAIVRDITVRKSAEAVLAESTRRLTTLIANLQGMVYRCRNDPDWTLEYVSDGCTTLTGYPPEDFVTERTVAYGDLIHPDDREKIWLDVQEALREQRPFHLKYRIRARDGTMKWVWELGRGVFSPDGTLLALEGYNTDITSQQNAEEALKKAHALLNETQEISHLGGWEYDAATGRITWTNEVYRIHGVGRDFDPGGLSSDIEFYTPESKPVIEEAFRRCCERGEPYDIDAELIRADGRQIWVRTIGKADVQDGRIVRVHGNIIDITDRRRAEAALRQANAYNRSLIEASLDPLVTISHDGKIQDVNSATEVVTGLIRNELVGTDFSAYFTEPENAREGYRNVFSLGYVMDYPLEIRHRDGHTVPVLYNATVYKDPEGHVRGVFAAARDITERKKAEEQREILIRELEKKNTELDRFTYTVSHDLKSPLIAIQSFLALLTGDLKTGNTGRVNHDIMRISESAEKLEHLITTLLSLSRSGRSVDTPVQIPFADLAREAAGLLDATLQQRGIRLVISDNFPPVRGDRHRLLQVMTNLLDNAVKFMGCQKEPCIEIGVRDPAGIPVFFVRDNGMGIDPADQPKVFGLFERIHPEITGTGIGLATVKRIIESHGGKIRVESEGIGKGTTFLFTLPVGDDNPGKCE